MCGTTLTPQFHWTRTPHWSLWATTIQYRESLDTIKRTAGKTVGALGLLADVTFVKSPESDTTVDEDTVFLVGGCDPDVRSLARATY